MSLKQESLWPAEFESPTADLPPVTILKQQAALLGQMTKNLIEGEVETRTDDSQRDLHHTFFLVAPALNFYRYPLLEVEHKATRLYPATIKVLGGDAPPFAPPLNNHAYNEADLKGQLKNVFASEETKRIIGVLLAQSRGEPSQA
jgi:hypothetical protein